MLKIVVTCYRSHGKLSQAFKGIMSAKIPNYANVVLDGNSESDFVQWHGGISDVFSLSDISQTQKDAYSASPLIWHFGEDRTIGMKTRSVVNQGWGAVDSTGQWGNIWGPANGSVWWPWWWTQISIHFSKAGTVHHRQWLLLCTNLNIGFKIKQLGKNYRLLTWSSLP